MPPIERKPDVRYSFEVTSALTPEVLFDLLADPRACLSWHAHPKGVEVLSVDAAPGAALAGAEVSTEGRMRGRPIISHTRVVEAERPHLYATASETTIPGSVYKRLVSSERYVLDAHGSGTLVSFETTASRELRGVPYVWPILKMNDLFFAKAAMRRCVVDFITAAERHVNGTAV